MGELKIPEVILRERRKKNLTQEELASSLGVSSQAISNWERGGYPDITLLPRIANYFGITVDELIGNDAVTREEDIRSFTDWFLKQPDIRSSWAERLAKAKEYYRKYPQDYDIMHYLGWAISCSLPADAENMALLREIHEKIMNGCTDEWYRRESMHRMCFACPDDELEMWIGKSELEWSEAVAIGELREERCWRQERFEEYRTERNKTDLMIFMHYIGRNWWQFHDRDSTAAYDEPEHTAAWECHKMRLLEVFDGNGVPEAWLGCYAECCLRSAGAMIGCGRVDEGFAQLERAFELYGKWNRIPKKTWLKLGNAGAFGEAEIEKDGDSTIRYADGTTHWAPYLWLFWQLKGDIYCALCKWKWFEDVKDDPRYLDALERARIMGDFPKNGTSRRKSNTA